MWHDDVHAGGAHMLKKSDASGLVQAPDGWVPPGGYDGCTQWALDNRAALEAYALQIEEEGTAAEQLQHFLAQHPDHRNE
jgi:hypothetical protein